MKVGFIGLGIMGKPMALNLIKGGHSLFVYGRRAESMRPLEEAGANPCASAQEAASLSEVTITMVPDTPDVEQVLFGANGCIEGAKRGAVIVDMSTISPVATRAFAARLAEKGIDMLDAPVSGGDIGAINATLSIMVGGNANVFQKVKPLFECMGKNIVHVGDHGAGQVAKACNNMVAAITVEAVSEAFMLAKKNGVDEEKVRAALLGGFAYSKVLELHGERILSRNFKPGFKAKLHQKDLNIVMQVARDLGIALPAGALAAQHMNALVGGGGGDLDSSALFTVVEKLNSLEE
jgi:2-hydroxy-3-oxopropionate reductase